MTNSKLKPYQNHHVRYLWLQDVCAIALTSPVVWSRMPCPDQDIVSVHFYLSDRGLTEHRLKARVKSVK
jgi:hypothetical protein